MIKDTMILGLDISTSVIGMCAISLDDKLHNLSFLNLKREKNLYEKAYAFRDEILKYKGIITEISIEDAFVKYKPGKSSAETVALLGKFNGMCSLMSYITMGVVPVHYNVNSARKLVFPDIKFPRGYSRKEIIHHNVSKLWPEIEWPIGPRSGKYIKQCYDMSDAAVMALTHKKVLENKLDPKTLK